MEDKKGNQIISTKGTDSVEVVSEKAIVKGRPDLYEHMYEIAKKHRDLANEIDQKPNKDIHRDMRPEIQESMISMVFALMCLEAYINTVAIDKLHYSWENLRWLSLPKKWLKIPQELDVTLEPKVPSEFAKDNELYKSFLKLNRLRNKFVHHNPKFSNIPKTKYGRTEGTINWVSNREAAWACEVVVKMVTTLHKQLNEPAPSWLSG